MLKKLLLLLAIGVVPLVAQEASPQEPKAAPEVKLEAAPLHPPQEAQGLPKRHSQRQPQEPHPFPFEESGNAPIEEEGPSFAMQLVNMFITLGLLISVVLLATWILKRLMRTRLQQVNETSDIKILEQRSLSNKTLISLIEVRDKAIVVAESHAGVTFLCTLESEERPSAFGKLLKDKLDSPSQQDLRPS